MAIRGRSTVWLAAATAIGLAGIFLSQQGALDPVRNTAIALTAPAQTAIGRAAESVGNLFDGLGGSGNSETEVRRLHLENQRLQVEMAKLREQLAATANTATLRQVVEERPADQFLTANVIARDPKDLRKAIAIDRGRRDGVNQGMVVVGQGGALVGTVARALDDAAWVTLLSDPNSRVNALVQETGAKGVVSGQLGGRPLLDLVPQEAALKPGDMVVTSGLGGTFPKAFLIGRIVAVESASQDPFKRATVEPAANLDDLEAVLVLTTFRPPKLERP